MSKGKSYVTSEGKICMIICSECLRENYSMAVASGQCAWCGYNPNEPTEPKQVEATEDPQTI